MFENIFIYLIQQGFLFSKASPQLILWLSCFRLQVRHLLLKDSSHVSAVNLDLSLLLQQKLVLCLKGPESFLLLDNNNVDSQRSFSFVYLAVLLRACILSSLGHFIPS